jgi:hypothetical protein
MHNCVPVPYIYKKIRQPTENYNIYIFRKKSYAEKNETSKLKIFENYR